MEIAVAHYPEGAGHATRMLAVGRAFEERGCAIHLAGGGPGTRFVELNGYETVEPTRVDFIGDFQGGSLRAVATGSTPDALRRVREFVRWLRRTRPDAVVTDDMFAAMAAPIAGVALYVVTHNAPGYYRTLAERAGAAVLTRGQVLAARAFYFPTAWPPDPVDPAGTERVGPIALDVACPPARPDPGVVVVPSHYGDGYDALEERLRAAGHPVTQVGGPDWEPVRALLPTLRAADAVVCSGYSTVMEAAVAGTPRVVFPFTSEQRGVARVMERAGRPGTAVARTVGGVAAAVDRVAGTAPSPVENAAGTVADAVLRDLRAGA